MPTRVDDRDLKRGARVLNQIQNDLEDTQGLAHSYAEAVLVQAVQNASARPTPQAAMAAEGASVQGDSIRFAGGTSAAVAGGSEFGSDIYLQFKRPHNAKGYWLMPASESSEVKTAADRALDDIVEKAVRRYD